MTEFTASNGITVRPVMDPADDRRGGLITVGRESEAWQLTISARRAQALREYFEAYPGSIPTAPGFYMTRYDNPDVFELTADGKWFHGAEEIPAERVRHDGGADMVRLVPESWL